MKYVSVIITVLSAFAFIACHSEGVEKSESNADAPIKREGAIGIAERITREKILIPDDISPVVQELDHSFILTYPMKLDEGMRGGSYYAKVTIDKQSGKITEVLVAP